MKFSLSDLEAFVAVADLASFRKAADSVHLSQPALSRRIGKLEGSLGVRLFDRTTRSVNLTAVGRDFAGKARNLLDELERSLLAMSEVAATQAGEVTVACVPSAAYYFLPDVIQRYHERFPRIRVRIVDEAANAVLAAVVRGEADFGLNFIGTQDPDIDFQPILKEPFVAACRRDHPLAAQAQGDLGRAGRLRLHDREQVERQPPADRPRAGRHARPSEVVLRGAPCVDAARAWSRRGSAWPRCRSSRCRRRDHPTLASVPLVEPTVTRTLGLIRRQGRTLSPGAQELYAMPRRNVPARAATRRKSAR